MAPDGGKQNKRKTVKGVRVACIGEVKSGVASLGDCDLPPDHDVFSMGELCPISELLNIPILVSRVRPSLRFAATRDSFGYDLDSSYYPNATIEALMICCDARLTGDSNGASALLKTPKRWLQKVGSVVLARNDHKPLHAHHVQVLLKFIRTISTWDVKAPYYYSFLKWGNHDKSNSLEVTGVDAAAEDIVALFTPGDFKEFYLREVYCWKHENDSIHLLDLPSPWSGGARIVSKGGENTNAGPDYSKRKLERKKYVRMTFEEKLEDARTWRECYLLTEIARLKARLGEGPETLVI